MKLAPPPLAASGSCLQSAKKLEKGGGKREDVRDFSGGGTIGKFKEVRTFRV